MTNPTQNLRFRRFIADADVPRLAHLLAEVEAVDHSDEDVSIVRQATLYKHDLAST
ncbi:MAG: hypothetical protein NVS4B11_18680 [Ktedonobacteraceae bacterium]